jgi:predicted DNA-binding protein (UPF0278 family)
MMTKFLFDVVTGVPITLGRQIVEKLRDEVDKERLITEESIRERLQQLQLLLQDGELTEEEYEGMEAKLIERLRAVRKYNQEMGGG